MHKFSDEESSTVWMIDYVCNNSQCISFSFFFLLSFDRHNSVCVCVAGGGWRVASGSKTPTTLSIYFVFISPLCSTIDFCYPLESLCACGLVVCECVFLIHIRAHWIAFDWLRSMITSKIFKRKHRTWAKRTIGTMKTTTSKNRNRL